MHSLVAHNSWTPTKITRMDIHQCRISQLTLSKLTIDWSIFQLNLITKSRTDQRTRSVTATTTRPQTTHLKHIRIDSSAKAICQDKHCSPQRGCYFSRFRQGHNLCNEIRSNRRQVDLWQSLGIIYIKYLTLFG